MFDIAEKGVKVLEIAEGSTIDDIKKSTRGSYYKLVFRIFFVFIDK